MSCWKCNTDYEENHKYCTNCTANILAYCVICYDPIYALKIDDIHTLFRDYKPYVGRPICHGCFDLLKDKVPDRLDCLKKKYAKPYIPLKIGLEKWM